MAATDADVGERVDALLGLIREQGGDAAADTAEEAVRLLVGFYGSGLERIVDILGAAETASVDALAEDPLVESQLILHGLHPLGPDERIERALDRVRPYLGSHAGGVAYLGIDEDSIAHLRLDGSCSGCPSSTVTVRMTIEDAVLGAAPELASIQVEGQTEESAPLLQIGLRPGAAPPSTPGTVWLHPSAAELPADEGVGIVHLEGRPVLMCRRAGTYYAYADGCPVCTESLGAARLEGDVLTCAACAAQYDVRLAGRAADRSGSHLDPLPLLDDASGIRVALMPEAV